jgi:hypothetical protein
MSRPPVRRHDVIDDVIDDMPGITSHASHKSRADGVEKREPDEVEAGNGRNDAAVLIGIPVASR